MGERTVSIVRYSPILIMNKAEKPCVGVPIYKDNEFDKSFRDEPMDRQSGVASKTIIENTENC